MDLDERMAFRRGLLFENVKITLNSHFIEAHTYHFKVMRTDKRGHCYIVMLDMSPGFMASESGQHAQLITLAAALTKNAHSRYGLVVAAVYWRVDETLAADVAQWARPAGQATATAQQDAAHDVAGNIMKYEKVTAEELAEFEAAWQKSSEVQIGDRTYSSDLAPLGDDASRR